MDLLRRIGVPLAAILIFLALWEGIVWWNGWPNYKMASPSDLPPAYGRYWQLFLTMGWQTLWRTVAGLGLAVIFGTLLGMVMGFRASPGTGSIRCSWASTPFPRPRWCRCWR